MTPGKPGARLRHHSKCSVKRIVRGRIHGLGTDVIPGRGMYDSSSMSSGLCNGSIVGRFDRAGGHQSKSRNK